MILFCQANLSDCQKRKEGKQIYDKGWQSPDQPYRKNAGPSFGTAT